MKLRLSVVFVCLTALSMLVLSGNAYATVAQEQASIQPKQVEPDTLHPGEISADGRRFRRVGDQSQARTSASTPQNTAGPDDYGYTLTDGGPLGWIDAVAGGTDAGLSGYAYSVGPILVALPFSFKYYENTYSYAYISAAGLVGFTSHWSSWQSRIPSPADPNNVIAPYWSQDIYLNATGPGGRVYYKSGGISPNRYFVVEWYDVRNGDPSDTIGGDDVFRFEVVLYENSSFDFQYQAMTYTGSDWCYTGAGIEDSTGLDGLQYLDGNAACIAAPSNTAVHFTRPAPTARVWLKPLTAGAVGVPGGTVEFKRTIRNTGDLGADTYDLLPSGSWPVTLYSQDSVTPLTDTDGDGTLDTGEVAQGWFRTIVIKVSIPPGATIGQSSAGQLIVQSSIDTNQSEVLTFSAAVPALFAQSYTLRSSPYVGLYRPTGQVVQSTTASSGNGPAVTTTPDGNLAQVWTQRRTNANGKYVYELYFAKLDKYGVISQAATRLTDHSSAVLQTYDYAPAIAVSPNGNIGVTWYRYRYDPGNNTYNYNIFYLVVNSAGGIVVPEANLSNNTAWGTSTTRNVPRFYAPTIAATLDNRLVIAWQRRIYTGTYTDHTVWYTVRATNGSALKTPTLFSSDLWSQTPNLTLKADRSVFLSQYRNGQIAFGRLNSSGTILKSLTNLTTDGSNYLPDAVQLPNGNVVITWEHWNGSRYVIGYAVLNSSLTLVAGAYFPATSLVSDDSPSVTYSGNRAVITWGDTCCDYQPNLYYALLDGNGNQLTPPMIFASDNDYYSLELPYNGQGNTYLPGANDFTPPTNPTSLTSSDHTVNVRSNANTVNVTWSGAADTGGSGLDGYSIVWDTSPATLPDGNRDMSAVTTSLTSPTLADGTSWYFHLRAVDSAGNAATEAIHLGAFLIDTVLPQSTASSPEFAIAPFTVQWIGIDADSGLDHYRLEVRDGLGAWTTWLVNTTTTSATYSAGSSITLMPFAASRLTAPDMSKRLFRPTAIHTLR